MEIKGYENYKVLSDGTVIGTRGKALKVDLNSTGYARITLCKDGVTKRVFVHRLVAEHYCDRPEGAECVNHIDGNNSNNDYLNLEWTTNSYNIQDGWNRGRVNVNKYSDFKIYFIKDMYANGYSFKAIKHRWGGDLGTIRKYATGG